MPEHSSSPPARPEPAAASGNGDMPPRDTGVPHPSDDAARTDGTDFSLPPTAQSNDGPLRARWRQALVWLLSAILLLAIGAAGQALVRKWQADQALHEVARVAALPSAATASNPLPGTAVAAVQAPAAPVAVPRQAEAPQTAANEIPANASGGPAGSRAGTAPEGWGGEQSLNPGEEIVSPAPSASGTTPAAQRPGAGAAGVQPPKRRGTADAKKRDGVQERRAAAGSGTKKAKNEAAHASETFKRCPPLGTKGAVMCRWHVCNGGAGKEPACRPYLDRRP